MHKTANLQAPIGKNTAEMQWHLLAQNMVSMRPHAVPRSAGLQHRRNTGQARKKWAPSQPTNGFTRPQVPVP